MVYELTLVEKPHLEVVVSSAGFQIEDSLNYRLYKNMSFAFTESGKLADPADKPSGPNGDYAFSNAILRLSLKDKMYKPFSFLFHINYRHGKPAEVVQASVVQHVQGPDLRWPPFAYKKKAGAVKRSGILSIATHVAEEAIKKMQIPMVYEAAFEEKFDERYIIKGPVYEPAHERIAELIRKVS